MNDKHKQHNFFMSGCSQLFEKMSMQKVYLINEMKGVVMKILPGNTVNFYAKFKGGKEYRLRSDTDLAAETVLEGEETTEKEYDNY
jgi:hypothetical protein